MTNDVADEELAGMTSEALVSEAMELMFEGDHEGVITKIKMALSLGEVEWDAMQVLAQAFSALRRFEEAKETAIAWGDLFGPSLTQLTTLLEAAYFHCDARTCASAARALQTFVSARDEEFDIPPMPASGSTRLRAVCLAQDLAVLANRPTPSDTESPQPPPATVWTSDVVPGDSVADLLDVVHARWLAVLNAQAAKGDVRAALTALILPFAATPENEDERTLVAEAHSIVQALAGVAELEIFEDHQAAASILRVLAEAQPNSPNTSALKALINIATEQDADAEAMRQLLLSAAQHASVLLRRRAALHLA